MSKFELAKTLPFAKIGDEIIIGESAVSVKTPEYGSASRSFLGFRSELDRLIKEGWVSEVKPREWMVTEYQGQIISNGGFLIADQDKVTFIKVREVL